jgi:hypothetical protein
MPLPNVNLKNVSMDYFLRGVDAARPQGAQQPQAPGQQVPDVQQPQREHPAGKLVDQLDVLLLKAAGNGTVSLTGSKIKRTFQKLVDDGALDRASLKALEKAGDTAAKTFKALSGITGRQLAEAVDGQERIDGTSTAAGKAAAAAIKAQQDLSDLLAQLSKGLDALVRHDAQMRAENPQYKGVDAKVYNEIADFRLLCDRRATEIGALARQMKDFAVHLAANGQNADPNVAAILRAKASALLPRQALAMHGTADALATVNQNLTAQLRPIAEKIDTFRRNPTASISRNELATLKTEIATMKAAIEDLRKNGLPSGGGRMLVPKDILKALETEVAKAEDLFKNARREARATILRNYVETAKKLYTLPDPIENAARRDSQKIGVMLDRRDEFLEALEALANAVSDPSKKTDDLNNLGRDLFQKGGRLRIAAIAAPKLAKPSMQAFDDMTNHLRGVAPMVEEIIGIINKFRTQDRFFTGAEAMAVFKGELSVSSVVEARARGLRDSDVDPANEDANIVADRPLATGAGGAVYELERADGTSVIFKGETESRTGLQAIAVGGGGNYDVAQKAVNLNFAAQKGAEALGMGGLLVRYSAGVHKGVFGFYMEKAKGATGREFTHGRASAADGLTAAEIKKLPPDEFQRIKGEIKRQLNRLQWLDLVTGQMDRHEDNYFIHVDRTTRQVTVKGIDNDAGYSQYRTGAMTFKFDEGRSNVFKSQLLATAQKIDPANAEALRQRYLEDPGITDNHDGTLTIDASRIADPTLAWALATTTGAQTLSIPDKIDRETYNALIALKSGPARQAYLDSIRPRLSEASYNAAVSRLDDTIAHAERLKAENKVVNGDQWAGAEETPLATVKLAVRKFDGTEKRIGGELAEHAHKTFCPSIYARDGFEELFR